VSGFRIAIGSFASGLVLFVIAAYVSVHSYDQVSDPAWLTALSFVAVALIAVGLLVMVGRAVEVSRGRR
jgi:hypothetical protein